MDPAPLPAMTRLPPLRVLLLIVLLLAGAGFPARAAEPVAQESIHFAIENLPLQQQGPQVVTVGVTLGYAAGIGPKDYPDFEEVYRKLVAWMRDYPAKNDYWEVFNKQLGRDVLKEYPMLGSVTLELTVHPTFGVPYPQTIRTTLTR
jgi:hypothetical protein